MISNFNHLRDGVQPCKLITCMVQCFILHTNRHHGGHTTNHTHWFNQLHVHMWCTTRMKPTCELEELLCVWGQVSNAGWGVLPGDGHGTGVHTHIGCGGAGGGGGRGHLHVQVSQLVLPLRCNLLTALWLLLSWITVCPHSEWTQSQDASVTCLPFLIVKKLKTSCGPGATWALVGCKREQCGGIMPLQEELQNVDQKCSDPTHLYATTHLHIC